MSQVIGAGGARPSFVADALAGSARPGGANAMVGHARELVVRRIDQRLHGGGRIV
ncbi:MAG: hypothetical protein ACLP50_08985 [Solirubrobacteraceae bacterium]